jgi:3-deoxy-manno-octulosonate cytidylyltransferase (CMP-KDO synthetase)
MLRILEHGYKIKVILTEFETYSVDTIEDLKEVELLMKNDRLVLKYAASRND